MSRSFSRSSQGDVPNALVSRLTELALTLLIFIVPFEFVLSAGHLSGSILSINYLSVSPLKSSE